jgi:hypothetical protein
MENLSFALVILMLILLIVQNILSRQKVRSARHQALAEFFPEHKQEVEIHVTTMEEGLVACVSRMATIRRILFTLLGSEKPLIHNKIYEIVRTKFAPDQISEKAVTLSLRILMNGSFVKLDADGYSVTILGKELCSRISEVK